MPPRKKAEPKKKPKLHRTRKPLPNEPADKIPPTNNGKHPGGRPSEYNEVVAAAICSRVSCGQSLRAICKDEHMPDKDTVFAWLVRHQEFSVLYTKAREEAADAMAEEILDICDDGSNDWMTANAGTDNEKTTLNAEHVQRSRLRVDTRKWLMAKLQPKKYGERVDLNHTGKVGVELITNVED